MKHTTGSKSVLPWFRALAVSLLVLPALVACVTINVYFPEAAVKDLSERIEAAVAQQAAESDGESESDASGDGSGGQADLGSGFLRAAEIALGTALHLLGPGEAHAQEVAAPEITNPAIRRIIASRSARVGEIDRFKSRGVLGENNQALLEARELGSLALQERAAVQKLVREENIDRERMFKEIAAATGADLSTLPQIQATYAQTLRQRARSGDWFQQPDGQWAQKP